VPGLLSPAHLPFSAIFGMDRAKKAMLCAMVNPGIKGVLIRGGSGTGKTMMVRSVGGIADKSVVNVPLNVTDEQLFGSLDIEAAIKEGRIVMEEGLMKRADGNLLYMDDADLFDPKMLSSVTDAVLAGSVRVERENISAVYGCDTTLIATMNSNNSYLAPGISDCFDIYVNADFPEDAEGRLEILRRNLDHEADADGLRDRYSDDEDELMERIAVARELLEGMRLTDDLIRMIASICMAADIDGFRGDLSMMKVSMALAALDGRHEAEVGDIEEAAAMCLPHRRKPKKGHRESAKKKEYDLLGTGESHIRRAIHDDRRRKPEIAEDDGGAAAGSTAPQLLADARSRLGDEIEDVITRIGEVFETIDLFENATVGTAGATGDSGMRRSAISRSRSGRYVGARLTEDRNPDLAFDATVRAASVHQRRRHAEGGGDMAVIIDKQDLREKIRETRSTSTFLFAVDASGSLVIRNRMMAVKGAILSLLKQHYAKRDRVGIMTFNSTAIQMVLPPSKSVESVYNILDNLPIGRRTPLSAALVYLNEYMTVFTKKHKDEACYVILVTDGNANVALDPDDEETDPLEEALKIASKISIPNVGWIVIDTEKPSSEVHNAERFAKQLRADYYTLEDLRA